MTAVYLRKLELAPSFSPAELRAFRSNEAQRLLADCLHECFGECADLWMLEKSEEGKPYLIAPVGAEKPPFISLSHSGEWVACAISDAPVGVDVQVIRPISSAVLARFCSDAAPDADDRAQTRLWTRYEACLKRYGSRAAMVTDAKGQSYDSRDLADAVVTVCYGEDEVEWVN